MSSTNFIQTELAAAIERGVRQCVVIGVQPALDEALESSPDRPLQVFALEENPPSDSSAPFVSTQFASEPLRTALEKSEFDQLKASLFVWLGGAKYRTADAVMTTLAFIASLPKGSGVVFDYAVERTCVASLTDTALDALASRICVAGGSIKHLIQPEAVAAMLRGIGFQTIVDLPLEDLPPASGRLVSAIV